jgi:hypothetical protein
MSISAPFPTLKMEEFDGRLHAVRHAELPVEICLVELDHVNAVRF